MGSTLDLEDYMGSFEGDNNDGITILDITDPTSPGYCFMTRASSVPKSAKEYLRRYYPKPNVLSPEETTREAHLQDVIQALASFPLIPMGHLQEAWPREFGAPKPGKQEQPQPQDEPPQRVPLLADLTFKPALVHALSHDEVDKLEALISTPDKAAETIEILRDQDPFPDIAIPLLKTIVKDLKMTSIDLSRFHISEDQLITIFTQLEQCSASVETLNISHNERITIQLLLRLLPLLPNLRRLILFKTAMIDDEIMKLVQERPQILGRIEGLIHPGFLQRPAIFSPAFTHICGSSRHLTIPGVSIPYFSPDQMIQMLSDFYEHIIHNHMHESAFLSEIYMTDMSQAAFCTQVRKPGKLWGQRVVPFLPHISLQGRQRFSALDNEKREYGFALRNEEVCQAFDDSLRKLRSDDALSKKDFGKAHTELKALYEDRMYRTYSLQDFFKQLEAEGRPAPDPDALAKLFAGFSELTSGEKGLKVMSSKSFIEYLDDAEYRISQLR